MKADVTRGFIREIITALAALVATYGWMGSEQLSYVSAAVIAVVTAVWSLCDPAVEDLRWSFARKAVQAIPPVLASFAVMSENQAALLTGLLLTVTAFFSQKAKKT